MNAMAANPARDSDCARFSPVLWHIVATAILLAVATMGCTHDGSDGPAPAPSVQPAPAPVAGAAMSDKLPPAVQATFAKDRPDAKVSKVKHRLYPDGMVHYLITSTDAKGVMHDDEYRSDGVKIAAK